MLKSDEAIYENGELIWLAEEPPIQSAHIIVTILDENPSGIKRCTPHPSIAG